MVALNVSVTPDIHDRLVHITARTDAALVRPEPGLELPIAEAVQRFFRAVGAGCFTFSASASPPVVVTSSSRAVAGCTVEEWEVAFPPLPEGAFGVLIELAKASALLDSGVVEIVITENAQPALPRLGADALGPVPKPAPPFPVVLGPNVGDDKEIRAIVTFRDPMDGLLLDRVRELFEAWGGVLFGGFPSAAGHPFSTGYVDSVVRHLPNEAVSTLSFFDGANETWDALVRGLLLIDHDAPVLRLDIG